MVAACASNFNFGKALDNHLTGYRSGDEHNPSSPYYVEPEEGGEWVYEPYEEEWHFVAAEIDEADEEEDE